jgi:hypothetical protein
VTDILDRSGSDWLPVAYGNSVVDDAENELRLLALDLFKSLLGSALHDINVSGMPHLGSLQMMQRRVNHDGLIFPQGDRDESAIRYLYRAWSSGNNHGRGLHFLRTYLQLLFPDAWEAIQQWHYADEAYPVSPATEFTATMPRLGDEGLLLDGAWRLGTPIWAQNPVPLEDRDGVYLTSRIDIRLDFLSADTEYAADMVGVFQAILPARFVPSVRYWIRDSVSIWPHPILSGDLNGIDLVVYGDAPAAWGEGVYVVYSDGL